MNQILQQTQTSCTLMETYHTNVEQEEFDYKFFVNPPDYKEPVNVTEFENFLSRKYYGIELLDLTKEELECSNSKRRRALIVEWIRHYKPS